MALGLAYGRDRLSDPSGARLRRTRRCSVIARRCIAIVRRSRPSSAALCAADSTTYHGQDYDTMKPSGPCPVPCDGGKKKVPHPP
jgi:hypothetical protein